MDCVVDPFRDLSFPVLNPKGEESDGSDPGAGPKAGRWARSTGGGGGPSSMHDADEAALDDGYTLTGFDEMFAAPGRVRPHYRAIRDRLEMLGANELSRRHRAAD